MQPQVDAGAIPPIKPGSGGPVNGDPNAPLVELPDVPCRNAAELSGARALGTGINAEIDGRKLAIDYPCGKHEGAKMTVILNLHGTLIGGASFLYQRSYFSAFRFADSHNLIVIHPQSASTTSAGAQWGNDDGGTDLPHLIAVMTWVYEHFARFDIRSTWIAGHSWGAVYAEGAYGRPGFVCDEMFKDRFKGVLGLSYIAPSPCVDRVSMIGTQGEEEDFEQLDQGSIAQMHGCDPMMKGPEKIGNNERYYWDGCDPRWVHEDWLMLGKGHIDSMDAEVVQKIVERIKSTEL
jgi:pimeloyl-ACP methyl ester carboxylesterase